MFHPGRSAAVLAGILAAAAPTAARADSWQPGPPMQTPRQAFVSERLGTGDILVASGFDGGAATASAELLRAGAGSWAATGWLAAARIFAASALLGGDRVLVAGGAGAADGAAHASAELWSPATGTFTATGPMNVARSALALTALADGRALAVGGSPAAGSGAGSATSELYDPATNRWTPSGSMPSGRLGQTATLLTDCRVLVVGDSREALLYNPASGSFAAGPSEAAQRSFPTATLLADGRVLLAGGVGADNVPRADAQLYDPATGTFSPAGSMSVPRSQPGAVRLVDGRVLVAGGIITTAGAGTERADLYDPATNSWSAAAPMDMAVTSAQAQLLPDGRAIVIGGGPPVTQVYTPDPAGPAVAPPRPDCSGLGSGGGGGDGGTGGGGTGGGGTGGDGATAVLPAKLVVSRASVRRGRLQLRGTIAGGANGEQVQVAFAARGQRLRFAEQVVKGRLRVNRKLPSRLRRVRTGTVTLTYAGNARIRSANTRLLAAPRAARLTRKQLSLSGRRLRAAGRIARAASGLVRLTLEYTRPDGRAASWRGSARIRRGRWRLSRRIPAAATGGGHLAIEYRGSARRGIAGQRIGASVR